jgi:aspyridone synthetase (hybrid polyketide synthase/nonribosomal peptide synthetase)
MGYLSMPEQTELQFIAGVTMTERILRVMYRTGDRGRPLSDGTPLCLRRLVGDTQIKLRGQRIELQEIEQALLQASEGTLASVIISLRDSVLIAHATLNKPSAKDSLNDESDTINKIITCVKLP